MASSAVARPQGAASMDLWTQLEQARSRWNVLEHPFYRRWSRGELAREELAAYAGQYRHAVRALADAAAGDGLGAEAEAVLRANWELLDGVERAGAARTSIR